MPAGWRSSYEPSPKATECLCESCGLCGWSGGCRGRHLHLADPPGLVGPTVDHRDQQRPRPVHRERIAELECPELVGGGGGLHRSCGRDRSQHAAAGRLVERQPVHRDPGLFGELGQQVGRCSNPRGVHNQRLQARRSCHASRSAGHKLAASVAGRRHDAPAEREWLRVVQTRRRRQFEGCPGCQKQLWSGAADLGDDRWFGKLEWQSAREGLEYDRGVPTACQHTFSDASLLKISFCSTQDPGMRPRHESRGIDCLSLSPADFAGTLGAGQALE